MHKLAPDQSATLEKALGIGDLKEIDFLEGMVENDVGSRIGVDDDVTYNKKDVPAARKLEALGQSKINKSISHAFIRESREAFWGAIHELVGKLEGKNDNQVPSKIEAANDNDQPEAAAA